MALYDIIMQLCQEKGITGYRLCKDVGLSPGNLTDLKMGRKNGLSAKNAQKIADYFDVTVGFLLTGKNENSPAADEGSEALKKAKQDVNTFMEGATEEELRELRNMIGYIKSKRS